MSFGALVPVVVGTLLVVFRRRMTEHMIRSNPFWRSRDEVTSRAQATALSTVVGLIIIAFGLAELFGIGVR